MDLIRPPEEVSMEIKNLWVAEYGQIKTGHFESLILEGGRILLSGFVPTKTLWRIRWEARRRDVRKRFIEVDELLLPTGNTQLIGPSGCGKTIFARAIAACLENRIRFQRGPTHFGAEGNVTHTTSLTIEDEGGDAPGNQGAYSFPSPKGTKERTIIKINQASNPGSPIDTSGTDYPHTVFMDKCKIVASMPTQELFTEETHNQAIEHYKYELIGKKEERAAQRAAEFKAARERGRSRLS